MEIKGVICDALRARTGFVMGKEGAGVDVDLAAAGKSEAVKADLRIMQQLGVKAGIDGIFITLAKQVHVRRPTISFDSHKLWAAADAGLTRPGPEFFSTNSQLSREKAETHRLDWRLR